MAHWLAEGQGGLCTLRPRPRPYSRWVTSCRWPEEGTKNWACQVWFEVEWQGWVGTRQAEPMERIMQQQGEILREQMVTARERKRKG